MFRSACLALLLAMPLSAAADVVANYDALAQSNDRTLRNERSRQSVVSELDRDLQDLGARYLPSGQTLQIRFVRLDLAGDFEPWHRGMEDVRIMRDTTPPRIHLQYALLQDGKLLRQGEARLSDLNYLSDPRARSSRDRLVHEKLLLQDWFRKSFPQG